MPKIQYERINFSPATLAVIEQANQIIATYRAQGYDLTLRQLYYQFVARDLIANKQTEYKRLGDIVSKGRRAGLIDWDAIVDRTRNLRSLSSWESPQQIMDSVADQFRYDRWLTQPTYVEVWFEKDALLGVFERVAHELRLPFFSCRGYTSDSEVWGAAQRIGRVLRGSRYLFPDGIEPRARAVKVLHFGDHDPSGLDMTRDIGDRLALFGAPGVRVERLALNFDQVQQYQPPPNPAKEADSRYQNYLAEYGDESWELDALEPTVLAALVRDRVRGLVDKEAWKLEVERERRTRAELTALSRGYTEAVAAIEEDVDEDAVKMWEVDWDEEKETEEEDDNDG